MTPKRQKDIAYVVPETHWDRAWYLPFEQFRIKLVKLTEDLLDLLDRKPQYFFTFDGQTVVLEDVAQIRPEFGARLQKHVESGQLAVGPWYVLPDEFLVSAEALVRNLLVGHRIAGRYGKVMKAGYIPDPFGHVSQLPQILQGFGIDNVLFARGLGEDAKRLGLEFRWVAPDGETSVMACHLVAGYGNLCAWGGVFGVDLSEEQVDFDRALEQAKGALDYLRKHKPTTRVLLLNNGVDHFPAQPSVPEMIEYVNARLEDTKLVQGNYEQYVEAVKKEKPRLRTYTGEMHDGKFHHILSGVFSSRMYLKQQNNECQRLLEAYAEPLCAFASLHGKKYPDGFLTYAWKELLKNHPHDDICGCSVDAVHQDMANRFTHVRQVGEEMANQGLNHLTANVGTASGPEGIPIVVFNPTAWIRAEVVTIEATVAAERLGGDKAVVVDPKGVPAPAAVKVGPVRQQDVWGANHIRKQDVRDIEVEFLATELPPFGLRTFFVAAAESGASAVESGKGAKAIRAVKAEKIGATRTDLVVRGTAIENTWVSIAVLKDGTVTLKDKLSGATFRDGHVFESVEDVGDEYDYSPLPGKDSKALNSKRAAKVKSVKVVENTPARAAIRIEMDMQVPECIAPDRKKRSAKLVAVPIRTTVSLEAGSRRVDFETTIDNRAKDHRMQVLFPTPIQTDVVHAESKFDVVTRPVAQPRGEGWSQPPVPTQHVDRFVSIDNGRIGFTLINKGMPEYEARPGKTGVTLCQTLFRSVDSISRDRLVTRATHAGPFMPAPEAQCLGPNTYRYAVVSHSGGWEEAKSYVDAFNHATPVQFRMTDRREGPLPIDSSLIRLFPESLVLSAVKQAEEGEGLIVRFYNIGTKKAKGAVEFHHAVKDAAFANLNEETLKRATVKKGNRVEVSVVPKGIVTLRVRFQK